MNTQTRSKSLSLPVGKWNNDRKVQTDSNAFVRAKKSKFLFTFTVLTWVVAVLGAIVFFFAVSKNLAQADLLACILLGTIFIGWILFAWHFSSVNKPVQPTGQGDRHE